MTEKHRTTIGVPRKRCMKCGKPKFYDEFYSDASSRDGMSPRCIACSPIERARRWLCSSRAWIFLSAFFRSCFLRYDLGKEAMEDIDDVGRELIKLYVVISTDRKDSQHSFTRARKKLAKVKEAIYWARRPIDRNAKLVSYLREDNENLKKQIKGLEKKRKGGKK